MNESFELIFFLARFKHVESICCCTLKLHHLISDDSMTQFDARACICVKQPV